MLNPDGVHHGDSNGCELVARRAPHLHAELLPAVDQAGEGDRQDRAKEEWTVCGGQERGQPGPVLLRNPQLVGVKDNLNSRNCKNLQNQKSNKDKLQKLLIVITTTCTFQSKML